MSEDAGSPHASAWPFIITPPITPTSLNPLRVSISFRFSPPFQPLTLFLEQEQRERREAAVEKWKRQGVANSKRWRTNPIWQVCATFSTLHWTLAWSSLHRRSTLTPSWPDHGITLTTSHLAPPLASALFPSTPYHLPSFRPLRLIFSFFLLSKWRGGKARSCGEATRQSAEKERRSTARGVSMGRALADTEKQWKACTLHCLRGKMP